MNDGIHFNYITTDLGGYKDNILKCIKSVNDVEEKSFSVSIIPHTSAVTTLGSIKKDDIVNIEIDILARYIENNIKKMN